LTSLDNGACGDISSTMSLAILPSPSADFIASSYTLTLPSDPVTFSNTSTGATSFAWSLSDGFSAETKDLTRKFTTVGYYTVSLDSVNEHDCSDSIARVITVISTIRYPTVCAPNGDKLNDVFRPYTAGVVAYDMMIFNRWGELIFRSDDLSKGW